MAEEQIQDAFRNLGAALGIGLAAWRSYDIFRKKPDHTESIKRLEKRLTFYETRLNDLGKRIERALGKLALTEQRMSLFVEKSNERHIENTNNFALVRKDNETLREAQIAGVSSIQVSLATIAGDLKNDYRELFKMISQKEDRSAFRPPSI